jgi:hypothetical protein
VAPGRPLVEAALGGPLIYALEEADRKAILVGFDLFKADFPLRVAFPLIMSNSLRWLHPGGFDHASLQLAAGQPLLLPLPHGVDAVSVTTPSGRTVQGRVAQGAASYTDTSEVGIYTMATARGEMRVAANLMDSEESDIAPRPLPPPAQHRPPQQCRSTSKHGRCSRCWARFCSPSKRPSTGTVSPPATCACRRKEAIESGLCSAVQRWPSCAPFSSGFRCPNGSTA